jgi:hypothetical protein
VQPGSQATSHPCSDSNWEINVLIVFSDIESGLVEDDNATLIAALGMTRAANKVTRHGPACKLFNGNTFRQQTRRVQKCPRRKEME